MIYVGSLSSVKRINFILMRIRIWIINIQDPDLDHEYFLKIYWFIEQMQKLNFYE